MTRGGKYPRSKWYLGLVIALITVGFLMPAPARALNSDLAIGCTILGLITTPLIAYGVWVNLPQNQGKEHYLNGEFYAGGYLGAAFTSSQNLQYADGYRLNNGPGGGSLTVYKNQFDNSLVGGLKFGYFFHTVPYLGLEVESSANNSYVSRRTLSINPPIQGASSVSVPNDFWINWTTALHIVGRYGFLPDKEVPFGRLQPYVGLGPCFVVLYEEVDSAKNFGIDVMAGVRYMITKHISAFLEYKFNYQWDVEIEAHPVYLPTGDVVRGTAHLDFATNKVVLGVAYHW